jgi:non-specific serine/threonine protein kinase
MRLALTWYLEADAEAGLRMAIALHSYWMCRDHYRESREWLDRVLSRNHRAPPALRAEALVNLAEAYYWLADFDTMSVYSTEGLALAREWGYLGHTSKALLQLGLAALWQGEAERAASLTDESVAVARQSGDNTRLGTSLLCRGLVAYVQHDYSLARTLHEESFTRFRQAGSTHMIVYPCVWLGTTALQQGDHARAKSLWEEALRLAREAKYQRGVAGCLECMARLRKAEGHAHLSVRLMAAAERLRTAISTPELITWHAEYEREVEETRTLMGEAAFAAAWAEGYELTWQQAAAEALEEAPVG